MVSRNRRLPAVNLNEYMREHCHDSTIPPDAPLADQDSEELRLFRRISWQGALCSLPSYLGEAIAPHGKSGPYAEQVTATKGGGLSRALILLEPLSEPGWDASWSRAFVRTAKPEQSWWKSMLPRHWGSTCPHHVSNSRLHSLSRVQSQPVSRVQVPRPVRPRSPGNSIRIRSTSTHCQNRLCGGPTQRRTCLEWRWNACPSFQKRARVHLARSPLLNRCSIGPGCLRSESQIHLRTPICRALQTKQSAKPRHGSMRSRHETFHDAAEGVETNKTSYFEAEKALKLPDTDQQ